MLTPQDGRHSSSTYRLPAETRASSHHRAERRTTRANRPRRIRSVAGPLGCGRTQLHEAMLWDQARAIFRLGNGATAHLCFSCLPPYQVLVCRMVLGNLVPGFWDAGSLTGCTLDSLGSIWRRKGEVSGAVRADSRPTGA